MKILTSACVVVCCAPLFVVTASTVHSAGSSAAMLRTVEGTVTGKVKFDGKRPELKPLDVSADKAKGCCADGKRPNDTDPSLVVAEDLAIQNVIVSIEVEGAKLDVPEKPFEVDQKDCLFTPHVIVVPMGSKVAFLNSDTVSHNVRGFAAKNDSFNKVVAAGGREVIQFDKADKISVRCDYHPWMSSWVFVSATPHWALTGADGAFSIQGLKPGTYKVKLWHEALGRGEGDVTVNADGTSAPLELKLAEKKKKV